MIIDFRWGRIGGIIGGVSYILLNLVFLLLGPEYRSMVDLSILPNIVQIISWIMVGIICGLILGMIFGKTKKDNEVSKKL